MPLDEPAWWYRDAPSGIADLPDAARRAFTAGPSPARYARAEPYRSAPAGDLRRQFHRRRDRQDTAGDPPVRAFAGRRPAARALTRGYGGRPAGPHLGRRCTTRPTTSATRPCCSPAAAPTLVARDRAAGAQGHRGEAAPVSAIVMDDGLQNPQLAKDLAIAMVDGSRGLGNGLVIPAGPLRAPLDFQLGLADAIVVNERCRRRRSCGRLAAASVRRAGAALGHRGRRRCGLAAGPARRRLGRHRLAAAFLRDAEDAMAPRWSSTLSFATINASGEPMPNVFSHRSPAPGCPRQHRERLGSPQRRDRKACRACGCHAGPADQAQLCGARCRAPHGHHRSALKGHRERIANSE